MISVPKVLSLVALILAAPLVLAAPPAVHKFGAPGVFPRGAIGAPLSVNTATIVFPVEGTIVSNSDAVYPRALLAMSGSGTVVGAWAVDGVPFDRFIATTNAGAPLEIRAHVPIPPTSWGEHRLSLIIDSPKVNAVSGKAGPSTTNNGATVNPLEGASVRFESSATSATRLTIYEPAERALIEGLPRIRWTLVPGASAYEVEILHVADDGRELGSRRFRTTETSWTPKDLGSGMMRLLASSAGFTRTNGAPIAGTTDYWILSLTPSIAFPTHNISLSPGVTIDRTTNDVAASRAHNETLGSIVQWSPPWRSSLVSGQLSATTTHKAASPTPSTRTNVYTAAVTLHLSKTRGLPMFAGPPPLPGAQPPAPPVDTSSGPTTAAVPASGGPG